MVEKLQEVRALGSAACEEWYKGLENTGRQRINDASRYERWELNGGLEALKRLKNREGIAQLGTRTDKASMKVFTQENHVTGRPPHHATTSRSGVEAGFPASSLGMICPTLFQ